MTDLRTNYVISHGFDESGRLFLQQWLWKMQVGWDLHPSISLPQDNDIKIADHGCGNGAWLLSLNSSLKQDIKNNVSLVGFDLVPVHYPAAQDLPPNIKLGILDAFTGDLPDEHVGQYNVVHVRVFSSVVKNNDPGPLIANAVKMLKAGGYFQWDEFDGDTFRALPPVNSTVSVAATEEMIATAIESSKKAMNLGYSWIPNLGESFRDHGLEVIGDQRMIVKPELRKAMSDSLLMMLSHVSRRAVRNGRLIGTEKDWEELWAKAGEEIQQGASLAMDMSVVIGRKPE